MILKKPAALQPQQIYILLLFKIEQTLFKVVMSSPELRPSPANSLMSSTFEEVHFALSYKRSGCWSMFEKSFLAPKMWKRHLTGVPSILFINLHITVIYIHHYLSPWISQQKPFVAAKGIDWCSLQSSRGQILTPSKMAARVSPFNSLRYIRALLRSPSIPDLLQVLSAPRFLPFWRLQLRTKQLQQQFTLNLRRQLRHLIFSTFIMCDATQRGQL